MLVMLDLKGPSTENGTWGKKEEESKERWHRKSSLEGNPSTSTELRTSLVHVKETMDTPE
jgi:hypothetical protein